MKEYIHEGRLTFVLDQDGDSFDIFQNASAIISKVILPEKFEFKNRYWDVSNGYFVKDHVTVTLEYSDWTGTVLRTRNDISSEYLQKVRIWAEKIFSEIQKKQEIFESTSHHFLQLKRLVELAEEKHSIKKTKHISSSLR